MVFQYFPSFKNTVSPSRVALFLVPCGTPDTEYSARPLCGSSAHSARGKASRDMEQQGMLAPLRTAGQCTGVSEPISPGTKGGCLGSALLWQGGPERLSPHGPLLPSF